MVKRNVELDMILREGKTAAAGRDFFTQDISILRSFGTASAYLAVLVLAHYLNSPEMKALYLHPQALWATFALTLLPGESDLDERVSRHDARRPDRLRVQGSRERRCPRAKRPQHAARDLIARQLATNFGLSPSVGCNDPLIAALVTMGGKALTRMMDSETRGCAGAGEGS